MKRKKLPSRKRTAIRNLLLALLMVLVVRGVFHTGYLLPIESFRYQEQAIGDERSRILQRTWDGSRMEVVYLAEGETGLSLGTADWDLFGWHCQISTMDWEPEQAFQAAGSLAWGPWDQVPVLHLWGCIRAPEIAELRVSLRQSPLEDWNELSWIETDTCTILNKDWPENNGVRRGVTILRLEGWQDWSPASGRLYVEALDSRGQVLEEVCIWERG